MPEFPVETYLTTTNDGLAVNVQGLCGGRITVWDPVASAYVVENHPSFPANVSHLQYCFNNTAYVEGVPNQSLVSGLPYYLGWMKDANGNKVLNFWQRGFTDHVNRYRFEPGAGGIAVYYDPLGNRCTLSGMVLPLNNNVLSILGGMNCRILTSNQPWSDVPPQPLPANTGQFGKTISNGSWAELDTQIGIYACSWAWRGAKSRISGRMANGAGTPFSTIFVRGFARGLMSGQTHYGPTIIKQITGAGYNDDLSLEGVNLALDDDAYYFGVEAYTAGGSPVHINVSHVVDGVL